MIDFESNDVTDSGADLVDSVAPDDLSEEDREVVRGAIRKLDERRIAKRSRGEIREGEIEPRVAYAKGVAIRVTKGGGVPSDVYQQDFEEAHDAEVDRVMAQDAHLTREEATDLVMQSDVGKALYECAYVAKRRPRATRMVKYEAIDPVAEADALTAAQYDRYLREG